MTMSGSRPVSVAQTGLRDVRTLTVVFADICGSTRMYASLGDQAARVIIDAGLGVIAGVLPEYRGRLVKTLGDEVMCVFADPSLAAMAAIEMQARIAAARPGGERLEIHVGMHHGPVLVEGGDVFGDTVNAASYLRAVACAGQILTTEATVVALSRAMRVRTRPLFFGVLKGSTAESAIHQVIWQADTALLTDINVRSHNLVPPDEGGVLVTFADSTLRIDMQRAELVLGRGEACDVRVTDVFASRRHAVLALRRTQVYLSDYSANGTFVQRANGAVVHVFRNEVLLEGVGDISLGRAFDQPPVQPIRFRRDRRALYRV
ncbi:MAG: FHA domain-containing protein [Betaproteobacteria bacterium]|nr:MAG: FHA domain-containing protein [Betaproteobacteria bacterium]